MKKAEKGTAESGDHQSVEELVASCAKSLVELECEFCSRLCFSKYDLEEHIKIRHSNKKYTCKVCGKGFENKSYFPKHMQIHENVFPYQCAWCPKACRTRADITSHLRTHNSEKPFKCNKCPATFCYKTSMQQHHLSMHTNEKPYECPMKCGRRFAILRHQRRHAMTHLNNMQKYVCAYCKKEWLGKDTLRKHISLRHANEPPPEYQPAGDMTASGTKAQCAAVEFSTSFPIVPGPENTVEKQFEELECQFCNRICFTNNELQEHMKIRHSNKKYTCDVCGKGFTKKSYLPVHMRIHEGVFPYQCPLCPKACRGKCNLANHMLTHSVDKPFKCDRCPATSSRKASIKSHQFSQHTNKKLYECPMECGRRFTTQRNQRRHARIHLNNAQKYVCAYCKKEHSLKGNLQKHIFNRHINESPLGADTTTEVRKYECAYCKKECSRKYNLRVHIFSKHANESPPEAQCASDTTAPETEVQSAANHRNKAPKYECTYCKKECSRKDRLRKHIFWRHEKPFHCELCTKVCLSKNDLEEHKKNRHCYKKYECPVCGNAICRKWYLKVHIRRMHADEFPYTCKVCPDAFKKQSELKRHICNRLYQGRKPYKCDRCLATFTTRETLQQHNRLTHRKSTENESVKIKKEETLSSGSKPAEGKEETVECSFQTHFAVKLEETPRYRCEPAEVNNWETIKCTLEPVVVKKEYVTSEEYLELKAQLESERTLRIQLEEKLQRLQETIMKRTLESDDIKRVSS